MSISSGIIDLRKIGHRPSISSATKAVLEGYFWYFENDYGSSQGRIPWDEAQTIFEKSKRIENSNTYTPPDASDYTNWWTDTAEIADPKPINTYSNYYDSNKQLNENTISEIVEKSLYNSGLTNVGMLISYWLTNDQGIYITGMTIDKPSSRTLSQEYTRFVTWDEAKSIIPELTTGDASYYNTPAPSIPNPTFSGDSCYTNIPTNQTSQTITGYD